MNKKIIISSIGFIVISLIIFSIYLAFNKVTSTTGMDLKVIPSNAKVVIDNKSHRPGYIKKNPGLYTVIISRDGYKPTTIKVQVEENQKVKRYVNLIPQTEEAKKQSAKDNEKILEYESAAGTQSEKYGKKLQEKYPITEHLPYKNLLTQIDYKLDGPKKDKLVVIITADSPLDRSYAIKQILNWGLKPADYVIEFRYVTNPFKEGLSNER
jgi:hypothetical protein